MSKTRISNQVLLWELAGGAGSVRKPRISWKNTIERDLKSIGWNSWDEAKPSAKREDEMAKNCRCPIL